ncbi:hypothetical protein GSI_07643 [Ganoderma sinense ZZ0214-1]|nr:hypothetical protein GSI_07643 [Ganoderma sinense ZZ0214-1]
MLLSFTWNPHPHPGFLFDFGPFSAQVPSNYAAFNPNWILNISRIGGPGGAGDLLAWLLHFRLVTLSLDITTDADSLRLLAQVLSSAPHLTSLNLGTVLLQSSGLRIDPWSTLPYLSFPELRSLSIYCDVLPFVQYVATQWTMPRLASLHSKSGLPIAILTAHGQYLTYLHIHSDWSPLYLSANAALPCLHELCPRLTHLVIRLAPRDCPTLNINSPTLLYLDLLAAASVAAYRAIALAPTARAPRLRKVRMIMTLPTCDFLPLHFHPTHLPGSDSALEDLSSIPGADESDDATDWLMLTTGGIEGWCPEGLVRQLSWAVIVDECRKGTSPPEAVWDSRIADSDDETDSDGVYEYESRPTSPMSEDTDMDDSEDGDGAEGRDGECEMGDARSEDGMGSDSDMEREWFELEPEMPNEVRFVDDPLDSSRGQYDRETILERFSQSQLGDFLLE